MSRTLKEMSEFFRAYVLAALWTIDPHAPPGDYEKSRPPQQILNRVTTLTLRKLYNDCEAFALSNKANIKKCGLSDAQVGHNFWMSRNGVGVGFCDCVGDASALRALHDAAVACGTCEMYVTYDNTIECL